MLLRIALFVVIACLALLVVGAEDYYKVLKPLSLQFLDYDQLCSEYKQPLTSYSSVTRTQEECF